VSAYFAACALVGEPARDALADPCARASHQRVTVNALYPAAKSQSFFRAIVDYRGLQTMADAANPMGRMGDPYGDIAPVAVFLASEACRYRPAIPCSSMAAATSTEWRGHRIWMRSSVLRLCSLL
jgi:NAD(P)-dependent dehydrogenase (short-subunit alcohol dehydrogenase family)